MINPARKEVPYLDKCYVDKRRILQQYYHSNVVAYELVSYIVYHCEEFETAYSEIDYGF